MDTDNLQEQTLNMAAENDRNLLKAFLDQQGLALDNDLEYAMALTDHGRIAAVGSLSGRVLKCIAVDDEYRERGLSARIVTHLVHEQFRRGRTHLFIYTKPANRRIFTELGFYPVAEVPGCVVLMENRPDGIKIYLEEITAETGKVVSAGAAVVNCNPFTLGHKFLLEYAAARCRLLHVFVVWEDRSVFPAEVRYRLVKEGISHLSNVAIHKGKDYIISNATFPTYFIKKYEDVVETHAKLDITVFAQHIAPALKIEKRFIGEEPYCPVTSVYNHWMKQILPANGIEVEEIRRITSGESPVSASRVRALIGQGDMQAVKKLVPDTTYRYLLSYEAQEIVQKLRSRL